MKLIILFFLNNSDDCAIYAIKFIELDMQGLGFACLNEDFIEMFWNWIGVDIFSKIGTASCILCSIHVLGCYICTLLDIYYCIICTNIV